MSDEPRYPDITVQLSGEDGNVFSILSRVSRALRRAGIPQEEREEFFADAKSSDYDHALRTCMRWVNVE